MPIVDDRWHRASIRMGLWDITKIILCKAMSLLTFPSLLVIQLMICIPTVRKLMMIKPMAREMTIPARCIQIPMVQTGILPACYEPFETKGQHCLMVLFEL